MEPNNNEIINRLKDTVLLKLSELDAGKVHDSTLIDYILVMVVNRKSKFEMKDNLALFLGKIVDDFVNWLFEFLSNLQSEVKLDSEKSDDLKQNESEKSETLEKAKPEAVESNIQQKENEVGKTEDSKPIPVKDISRKKLRSTIVSKDAFIKETKENPPKSLKRSADSESDLIKPKKIAFEVDKKESEHQMFVTEEVEPEEQLVKPESETKFVVTLDGVTKDMFKDDLFLLDEDFDPELMNEDLSNLSQRPNSKKDKLIKDKSHKAIERCKFWPSCMNGSKCEFYHPIIKCTSFPYCRFGDKCLYKHPICKYDSVCSRKDCPFFHISKRIPVANTFVTCKFYPKCVNENCEFFHPKNCHYGAGCKLFSCPFIHPTPVLPHPSQLKWKPSNKNTDLPLNNKKEIESK